jgi:hypothetical protein
MQRQVFDLIYHDVQTYDDYFILKKSAIGNIGLSGYQKCAAAMRMLAYGTITDSCDQDLWMSESTCLEVMVRFATAVVKVFGADYLREPTPTDTTMLMAIGESRGFIGMLGSMDCMHRK